jgi:hypothetical protein
MVGFIIALLIVILGGMASANILVWWQALILGIFTFILASCFMGVKK